MALLHPRQSTIEQRDSWHQNQQKCPPVSHLFFADDTLLFLKATLPAARCLKSILSSYENLSGQRINLDKSEMVRSPNVDDDLLKGISEELGIQPVSHHSKYLGLPMLVGLKKCDALRKVEEKLYSRIGSLESNLLSRRSKEILIKSVLQALPTFSMQCYKIPRTMCARMSKAILQFFWNGTKRKGIHWIRSETMFYDKEEGGMGLRHLETFNDALLLKQAWRIATNPDLLLSRIYKGRYFRSSDLLSANSGSSPSHAWRGICKIKNNLIDGIAEGNEDNQWRWRHSSSGLFETKSAYKMLMSRPRGHNTDRGEVSDSSGHRSFWKRIWRAAVPGKIRLFLWRASHNALPTGDNLIRRCCARKVVCPVCGFGRESAIHLFRDCWWAKAFWAKLGLEDILSSEVRGTIIDWLWDCSSRCDPGKFRFFICGCWLIWRNRNELLFQNKGWLVEEASLVASRLLFYYDIA